MGHYLGAYVFFLGFIFVIFYTSVLGVRGTLTKKAQDDLVEDRPIDSVMSQLSIAFIGLVVLTIVGWLAGLVSFFFFEVFALLNFALYYVQTLIHPFPYNDYEFKSPMVNSICRFLQLMASDRS